VSNYAGREAVFIADRVVSVKQLRLGIMQVGFKQR
jgi:hypothetical protein